MESGFVSVSGSVGDSRSEATGKMMEGGGLSGEMVAVAEDKGEGEGSDMASPPLTILLAETGYVALAPDSARGVEGAKSD